MAAVKILVFAGSIRTGAFSGKLAAAAAKAIALADGDVTLISLADYPMPIYDADLEEEKGIPDNAMKLARLMAAQHGVFIATPEYNHSLPPLLKNAIDWISRPKAGHEHRHKVFGIGSSSNGLIGGARALIDLRKVVSTGLGALVIPEQISVSTAGKAFDEAGHLADKVPAELLERVAQKLVATAGALREGR